MISDHYSVYCIREKKKERKTIVTEIVRDYKNFKKDTFCQLLSSIDWREFDVELDMVVRWEYLYKKTLEILSILCPYKKSSCAKPPGKGGSLLKCIP